MPKPKPKIWFDYEYLSSLDNPDAPKELFYLSEPAQKILADFAETLLWPTRWYYQYDDQLEEPPALAFRLREELKVPYHLDDLIPLLDDIEPLLQQLLSAQCCSPGEAYDFVGTNHYGDPEDTTVGSGALPEAFLANPLADYDSSGSIGWDDYSVYLCDAAYRVAEGLETILRRLRWLKGADTFVEGLASEIVQYLIRELTPQPWEEFAIIGFEGWLSLLDALEEWMTAQPSLAEWDTIIATWENTVKQQVLCHIAEAATADTAAADVRSDMQSLYASITWDALWALYPFQRILRKVFEGAEAYEGPIADCTCETPLPSGWRFEQVTNLTGAASGGGTVTFANQGGTELDVIMGNWSSGDRPNPAFSGDVPADVDAGTATQRGIALHLEVIATNGQLVDLYRKFSDWYINNTTMFKDDLNTTVLGTTLDYLWFVNNPSNQPDVPQEILDMYPERQTGLNQNFSPPYRKWDGNGIWSSVHNQGYTIRVSFKWLVYEGNE